MKTESGGAAGALGSGSVAHRLWRLASSTKTATWLLFALCALALVGMVYPQSVVLSSEQLADWRDNYALFARTGEFLGLDNLFSTWYFVLVLALTVLSAAACTSRRLARRKTRPKLPERFPASWTFAGSTSGTRGDGGAVGETDFGAILGQARLALSRLPGAVGVHREGEVAVLSSGRVGFWGSMALHLALIAIGIGGVVSSLTTFQGMLPISEGETVVDEPGSYVSINAEPRLGPAHTGSSFRLDELAFVYEGDTLTRSTATLSLLDEPNRPTVTAEVNYPFELRGRSFLLGRAGYTADVLVASPRGEVAGSFRLGERQSTGYGDTVSLPDGLVLELFGAPTHDLERGEDVARRYDLRDPWLYVRASRGTQMLWEGPMDPGATVAFDDYSLSFRGLGFWNELMVRGDRGRHIVYAGLWLAVLGFAVRVLDMDARVILDRRSDLLRVACRHRLGRASSERLARRLAQTLDLEMGADMVGRGENDAGAPTEIGGGKR